MKAAHVLLLLAVLALSVPGFAQAPDDKLIVPGQRIGKWTLGMTIDDLLRMNGPRNSLAGYPALELARAYDRPGDAPDNSWIHAWGNLGLLAMTIGRESQTVVWLATLFDGYRTDKGVRVGVTKEAVQSAYGPPTVVTHPVPGAWTGVYDQTGLAVRVGSGSGVGEVALSVSVFRPGTAKQCYKF